LSFGLVLKAALFLILLVLPGGFLILFFLLRRRSDDYRAPVEEVLSASEKAEQRAKWRQEAHDEHAEALRAQALVDEPSGVAGVHDAGGGEEGLS
jgi:hypothetical protein